MAERATTVFLASCGALALLLTYRHKKQQAVNGQSVAVADSDAAIDTVADMCARRERLANWSLRQQKKRVPVALITGSLGSGKTTLLKHIMREGSASLNFGVVVNDFAELNIDAQEVKSQRIVDDSVVYEMSNGCICCSMKGSFESMIVQIGQQVDYLLIETSGVTNPLEMLSVLEKSIQDIQLLTLRLDCLIAVVDADVVEQNMNGDVGQLNAQMDPFKHADVVLLNKISLVSNPDRLVAKFKQICPPSTVIRTCEFCNVPLDSILDVTPIEPAREGENVCPDNPSCLRSLSYVEFAYA